MHLYRLYLLGDTEALSAGKGKITRVNSDSTPVVLKKRWPSRRRGSNDYPNTTQELPTRMKANQRTPVGCCIPGTTSDFFWTFRPDLRCTEGWGRGQRGFQNSLQTGRETITRNEVIIKHGDFTAVVGNKKTKRKNCGNWRYGGSNTIGTSCVIFAKKMAL